MTGFALSDASPDDAVPLARILGDWLRATDWMPVLHNRGDDLGFVRRMIGSHRVFVARAAAPLGFIAVRQGDIAGFYVADAARSRGIGTALLDRAKTCESRLALWTFQANTRAIAFYARHGFVEVDRTDGAGNEERLPDVRMIWKDAA
ncbi:MAG: GNAT family N-acetyltransferase [Paracoccaceae bacterium]